MAPIANLFDAFDDAIIASKWTVVSGAWVEGGGSLCATMPATAAIRSTDSYSLTQSSAFLEIVSFANGAGAASGLTSFRIRSTADNTDYVEISLNASTGNITYQRVDNNVVQETLTEVHDATAMRWWRIRSSGGTTYYETAPDGATWITQFSTPSQTWESNTQALLTATQSGGAAITKCFDDFNVAPGSSRAVPVGSEFEVTTDGELRIERCDKADAAWPYACSESAYNGIRRSSDPCGLWVQPPAKQHLGVENVLVSVSGSSSSDEVTIITMDLVNPDSCRTMEFYLPLVGGVRFFQPAPSEDAGVGDVIYWSLGAQVTGVDNPDDSYTTLVADDFRAPGTNLWRGVSDYYWTAPPGGSTQVIVKLKVFKAGGSAVVQNFQAELGFIGWSVLAP